MTHRGEPPLARLTAVFAIVVAMAACSDTSTDPDPTPAPAPAPAPGPGSPPREFPMPAPDPGPDRLDELTAEAAATRLALLDAAQARDWDAVAALIPEDVLFTSNFAGESDHIAYFRAADPALLDEVMALLQGPFAQLGDIFVWPELHGRAPFVVEDDERRELEERYGADRLAQWEAAGSYLGWRVGITAAGDWIFLVAGD